MSQQTHNIESVVSEQLRKKALTISTAESCTGGYIAHLITSLECSSDIFIGAVIAYHPTIKMRELDISPALIDKVGIVSPQVAEAMARNIARKYNTNIGISSTGYIGGTGQDKFAENGIAYIGICYNDNTYSYQVALSRSRINNIHSLSNRALVELSKLL